MNNTHIISKEDSKRIEDAIHFLSENYQKTGFNEKPVVLHSLRTAFILLNLGLSPEVVITAILHDLIEDSKVSLQEIKESFGEDIALNVQSVTEDREIVDYEEKYKEALSRTIERGENAVLVKAADLYDNSFYICLGSNIEKQKLVIDKIGYFLDETKKFHYGELGDLLQKRYEEELQRYEKVCKEKL